MVTAEMSALTGTAFVIVVVCVPNSKNSLSPQHHTSPLAFNTQEWFEPSAMLLAGWSHWESMHPSSPAQVKLHDPQLA
jgi:hypothetical protein